MKSWRRILLIALVLLTVLSLLLSACGPVEKSHGNSNPGKEQEKSKDHGNGNGKDKDKDKKNDQANDQGGNADKILICHKTGSTKKPYVQISVANDAARDGHGNHPGDIIPAPEAGCPAK